MYLPTVAAIAIHAYANELLLVRLQVSLENCNPY